MSDDQDGCEWVSVSSCTGLPGSPKQRVVKRLCVHNLKCKKNVINCGRRKVVPSSDCSALMRKMLHRKQDTQKPLNGTELSRLYPNICAAVLTALLSLVFA